MPSLVGGALIFSTISSWDFLDLELCGLDELPETTLLVVDLLLSLWSSLGRGGVTLPRGNTVDFCETTGEESNEAT